MTTSTTLVSLVSFTVSFCLLLNLFVIAHVHGIKGVIASLIGAMLFTLLSRPWWKRWVQPHKRAPESFRDPRLGSRAERRAAKRRHQ